MRKNLKEARQRAGIIRKRFLSIGIFSQVFNER